MIDQDDVEQSPANYPYPRFQENYTQGVVDDHIYPLHEAAYANDPDLLREQLDQPYLYTQLNVGTKLEKATPLHLAAAEGHTEVVRILLDKGANVMASDAENRTPLDLACAAGFADISWLLLPTYQRWYGNHKAVLCLPSLVLAQSCLEHHEATYSDADKPYCELVALIRTIMCSLNLDRVGRSKGPFLFTQKRDQSVMALFALCNLLGVLYKEKNILRQLNAIYACQQIINQENLGQYLFNRCMLVLAGVTVSVLGVTVLPGYAYFKALYTDCCSAIQKLAMIYNHPVYSGARKTRLLTLCVLTIICAPFAALYHTPKQFNKGRKSLQNSCYFLYDQFGMAQANKINQVLTNLGETTFSTMRSPLPAQPIPITDPLPSLALEGAKRRWGM